MALPLATIGSSTMKGAAAGSVVPGIGTAIGAGVGFVLGLFSASAEQDAEREAYKQMLRNKILIEREATKALVRGEQEIGRRSLQDEQLRGTQRAALAHSGVSVSSGSAVDLQADSAAIRTMDSLTIRANAGTEAYGYKLQSWKLTEAFKAAKKRGDQEAFSQFISSGAELAGSIYRNRKDFGLGSKPEGE